MERPEQLADAYLAVAQVDHYMVGIVEPCTLAEREQAEQILIARQNAGRQSGRQYKRLELALDLIGQDTRKQRDGTRAREAEAIERTEDLDSNESGELSPSDERLAEGLRN